MLPIFKARGAVNTILNLLWPIMQQSVKEYFSNVCDVYEKEAGLQKQTAGRLAASLQPWLLTLPCGPVLELGAGTGFFTRELMQLLPGRDITVTDLSDEMLAFCRTQTPTHGEGSIRFQTMDAETFTPNDETYALVAGNFVAQWFKDPALILGRFAEVLEPGGLLLMAFPGSDSFPEWRQRCHELGLPFTGNTLPDTEEMVIKLSIGPAQVDFYEDSHTVEFPDAFSFFQHLKRIGATKKLHDKQLNAKQFRLLINHWDQSVSGSVKVTWHLVFLALKRDL